MSSTYQPTARRPIAAFFRATGGLAVNVCLKLRIHPDAISWASVVVSLAAGICFWRAGVHPFLLLVAPGLCVVRLWLNMLDGMVAFAAGKASLRGELLNDLPDRFSDVLIFAGVAHSGLCFVAIGYWAAILAVLTAYTGITGQALAGEREYAGIMSKPWRMAWLSAGSLASYLMLQSTHQNYWGPLMVLDWTCAVIILGCLQTIAVRLRHIFRAIADREKPPATPVQESIADSATPPRVPRQRPRPPFVNALPARRS